MNSQSPTAQSGPSEEVPCSAHPDAPHGFNRNASHTEDRYVCDCEGWNPPSGARDAVTDAAVSLRGLADVIRRYGTCAPAALEVVAERLEALAAQPAPVGNAVVTALKAAYNSGWHECARMAKRDDLHCDIDSPFVEGKRQAAIESAIAGNYEQPAPVVGGALVGSRFFIDHGIVHNRKTGKHLRGTDEYGDNAADLLAVLHELENEAFAWKYTAKAFDASTRPAESVAQGGESERIALAYYSAALARAIPHLPTQSLRNEFAEILNAPAPATGSGGEAPLGYVCGVEIDGYRAKRYALAVNEYKTLRFNTAIYTHPAPADGDAELLDWLEDRCHQLAWTRDGERIAIRADDGAEFTGDTWRDCIRAALTAKPGAEGAL